MGRNSFSIPILFPAYLCDFGGCFSKSFVVSQFHDFFFSFIVLKMEMIIMAITL